MKLTLTLMSTLLSPSLVFIGMSSVFHTMTRSSNSSGGGGLMSNMGTCLASSGVIISTHSSTLPCDMDEVGVCSVRISTGLSSMSRHSELNQRFSRSIEVAPMKSRAPTRSASKMLTLRLHAPGMVA